MLGRTMLWTHVGVCFTSVEAIFETQCFDDIFLIVIKRIEPTRVYVVGNMETYTSILYICCGMVQ